jgi:hypothetical protein
MTGACRRKTPAIINFITEFENSLELSFANYQFREFAENFPVLRLERAPSRVTPSELPISETARRLIIAFEVSSEAAYVQRYQRPIWPGGRSGVTIGIGYDIGYVTAAELRNAWGAYLSAQDLDTLSPACGVTGLAARDMVDDVARVVVSWDIARRQFAEELKRYVALTQSSLPNFTSLSEHCRGALASLVYNRGPSFDAQPSRYQEMRNIRQHMIVKNFPAIPGEIRGMTRLWPDVKGLLRRREAEAALFEAGLQ